MTKRIFWKKGMRLTDDILIESDKCHLESLSQAYVLAAANRYGLLTSNREFRVSLSINKNLIDVEALSCLAITKSGDIIDVMYDTSYTNSIDTRVAIPLQENATYILAIQVLDRWRETQEGYCEPEYKFILVPENTTIEPNSFPIARIVDDHGWRADELNFVPPCLYISSHYQYIELSNQFKEILNKSSQFVFGITEHKQTVSIFLPIIEQLRITIDKEIDLMTPMMLYGNIQKYISGFYCGCTLDETLNLSDADIYRQYINTSYNHKEVYARIKEGIKLCHLVCEKLEKLNELVSETPNVDVAAPTISSSELFKNCKRNKTLIAVENNCVGAVVYYSSDGGEPSKILNSGNIIDINPGFASNGSNEPDKIVTIKVKAMLNGVSSKTNTYKVSLHKDSSHWSGISI